MPHGTRTSVAPGSMTPKTADPSDALVTRALAASLARRARSVFACVVRPVPTPMVFAAVFGCRNRRQRSAARQEAHSGKAHQPEFLLQP